MPILLSKLALIEPGTPDTVVTMSAVLDGGEGATRTAFSIEPVSATIEDGQVYWPKADYTLSMAGLKGGSSDKSQLDTWYQNETVLTFAGYGNGYIFQGEGKLNYDPALGGDVGTWRIESRKQSLRGYGTDGRLNSRMMVSENGFNEYLWGDADSSGVADGWVKSGTCTLSFSSGQQVITIDENTGGIERELYFPFAGETLTFSVDIVSYANATNLTRRLEMEYIDVSGSTISTDTATFTGTGISSIQKATPSGVNTIKFRIEADETGTGSASIVLKNPSVRNDNSTVYISR